MAAINRPLITSPVIVGTLYIFTLISLLLKLVSTITSVLATYVLVDPRIDFESRES
tara:strand:- start:2058 stop:2225 length:168 start_codon:yes stop_codon:yes gene_type:complete